MRQTGIYLLLALAIGSSAVVTGHWVRGRLLRRQPAPGITAEPTGRLGVGSRFPVVTLINERGDTLSSDGLTDEGAVVLLLDPDCSPCVVMARKWQRAIDEGVVAKGALWAVSSQPLDDIRRFKRDNAITFPVYRDGGDVFHRAYEVEHYPLELVVDRSRRIQSASYDSRRAVDGKVMQSILGGR